MELKKLYLSLILLAILTVGGFVFLLKEPASRDVHVSCETTKGPIRITIHPEWSPRGAARFLELVDDGFFTNLPMFRCMAGFLCQFGAKPGQPSRYTPIQDDPRPTPAGAFEPGYLSFAGYGKNSRANHIFISLAAVPSLGQQPWETPLATVDPSSMEVVKSFETRYGDSMPRGQGPEPQKIEAPDGPQYLRSNFPDLDYFVSCERTAVSE
ncbi:MAG: peptidylprolyl isomerase [Bdellovibrionales bacterium]